MKELYIFDMGGVVSHNSDLFHDIAAYLDIAKKDFIALAGENLRGLMEGRITSYEFWSRFSEAHGKKVEEDLYLKFFNPILDKSTIAIIKRLKKSSKVVCATNTIDSHYDRHLSRGDYNFFDAVYASNKIGISKPNPDFYRYILKQEKINPKNVLFIDDDKENVLAAERLGIEAVLFTDSASLSGISTCLKGA